jgi:hypothetical protein
MPDLTINGVVYPFPDVGDKPYAQAIINWATAATGGLLQKSAGSFTLTADVDFGANFGPKAAYFSTRAANPASAGLFRLANGDVLSFRNFANSADLDLAVNASDQLTFKGVVLAAASGDVQGPAGATDGAICAFDGVTGKLIKETTVKRRGYLCFGDGTSAASITITQSRNVGIGGISNLSPGENHRFYMHRAGSILGYSFSDCFTNWVATEEWHGVFHIRKNGSRVVSSSQIDFTGPTNTQIDKRGTQASGTDTFVAGDYLDIEIEFISDVGSVGHVITGFIEVEFDT